MPDQPEAIAASPDDVTGALLAMAAPSPVITGLGHRAPATSGARAWHGEAAEACAQGRADGAAEERERWRSVLADHYLMGINCDPDTLRDNPMCGCSRINLGWHPSIGAARQAWVDHVTSVIGDRP